MKINRKNPLLAAYAAITIAIATQSAQAITYYWDGNNGTTGFGSASGTWAAPTTGTSTAGWTTSATGVTAISGNSITTTTSDALNFGTGTSPNGLGSGTITVSGTVNAASLTFGSQTTGNITLTGGIINLGSAATISVGAGSTTVHTIASQITTTTGFTKSGNTLALSGANSYSGATNITSGSLIYRNTGAKSASSTHTFSAGTTLGLGVATSGAFFTDVDITNAFAGTMTGNLSNVVVNANTNVGIDTTAGNFTYATSVAGSPGRGLVKFGSNTLTLTGANTHTGITSILGGTLRLENAAAALSSSSLSVGSGTTLQLAADTSSTFNTTGVSLVAANVVSDRLIAGNGVTQILGNASVSNATHNFTAGLLVNNTGTAAIQLGNITNASGSGGTVVFNPTTANLIVTGGYTGITNAGTNGLTLGGTSLGNRIDGGITLGTRTSINLTKDTASIWTLSGTNSYNGGTALSAGRLQFTNLVSMPATGVVAVTGGTLGVNLGGAGQWTTGASGNGTIGGLLAGLGGQSGGTVTYTGTVALGFDTSNASPSTQTFAGAISNVGTTLGITKLGTNTLALTGLSDIAANNYSGATIIDRGTLAISHATTANLTGSLVFGESVGSTNAATLDLSAGNASFASLSLRTNTASSNTIAFGTNKTLTINGGVTVGANVANAVGSLVTSGAGNLVVGTGGTNTFQIGGVTGGGLSGSTAVDLSSLASFTLNYSAAGTLRLGDANTGSNNPAPSTLKLATDNTITVGNFRIGDSSGGQSIHVLTLGKGANAINATTVNIGSAGTGIRSGGSMVFDGADTTGTLTLRGFDGLGSTILNMVNTTGNTVGSITSIVNLAGHTADLKVSTLTMALRGAGGGANSTLTFDQGTLGVTTLNMSNRSGTALTTTATVNLGDSVAAGVPTVTIGGITMAVSSGTGAANANLNISGGNVAIGSINMANAGALATSTSTITLTGGTTTLGGDITRTGGAGTETATLSLNGANAVLDMTGKNITSLTSITYTDGLLKNLGIVNTGMTLAGTGSRVFDQGNAVDGEIQGAITGSGLGFTKQGLGSLKLSVANSYDGGTNINGGNLEIGHADALGTSGTIAFGGGTLKYGTGITTDLSGRFSTAASQAYKINTNGNNVTFATDLASFGGTLTKSGTGVLTLGVANSYTGGTTVTAGTLQLSNNSAAGTAGIAVSGASAAILQIDAGITLANNITFSNTNAASSVKHDVAISGTYSTGTTGNLTSSFAGGQADTTAQILGGTSTVATTLEMLFKDTSAATNDAIRRSDVFTTNGTSTDTYVIQLSTGALAADSALAWLNGSNEWVHAGTTFFNETYTFAARSLGDYGFSGGNVWAVVDHGGSFAAVPEPTSALAGLLIGAGLLRRRRSTHQNI